MPSRAQGHRLFGEGKGTKLLSLFVLAFLAGLTVFPSAVCHPTRGGDKVKKGTQTVYWSLVTSLLEFTPRSGTQ